MREDLRERAKNLAKNRIKQRRSSVAHVDL
eukprot:SAG31_NODE_16402_length_710_cov_1.304419_1_plen_29_part_01